MQSTKDLTVGQVAKRLGVTTKVVYRLILAHRRGEVNGLPAKNHGYGGKRPHLRVAECDLVAWISRNRPEVNEVGQHLN